MLRKSLSSGVALVATMSAAAVLIVGLAKEKLMAA
jgi:hypothetical protein